MRYGFVLTQERGGAGLVAWEHTVATVEVLGTVDELTDRLRPWALEFLRRDQSVDGRYFAHLVELDPNDRFDTYCALASVDVIWFYELEHVPVVGNAASSDLV